MQMQTVSSQQVACDSFPVVGTCLRDAETCDIDVNEIPSCVLFALWVFNYQTQIKTNFADINTYMFNYSRGGYLISQSQNSLFGVHAEPDEPDFTIFKVKLLQDANLSTEKEVKFVCFN